MKTPKKTKKRKKPSARTNPPAKRATSLARSAAPRRKPAAVSKAMPASPSRVAGTPSERKRAVLRERRKESQRRADVMRAVVARLIAEGASARQLIPNSGIDIDVSKFFQPAIHPKAATPASTMAMDEGLNKIATDTAFFNDTAPGSAAWAASMIGSSWTEGLVFPGYAYLSQLAQRPEYRKMAEVLAMHSTRKWIKLKSANGNKDGDDKSDKIAKLTVELERLGVREAFQTISQQDSFFGRAHLYLDIGDVTEQPEELKTSIGDGSTPLSKAKVALNSLRAVRPVEAIWCYPTGYNSNDPLKETWYKPSQWFVMGKETHVTRLLPFISRPVPDILKPAYSFGGLPLIQMAQPYVDNWLRTRQSISDLIHAFSVMGIKTDLGESLGEDGDELFMRAQLFNLTRDNKGLMMLQNGAAGEGEDFFNYAVPLGTLDQLQAQAQEQMCTVAGMPVIILLGLTPHGLNATAEPEIRVWNEQVRAYQRMFFDPNLKTVIDVAQLSLFGEVDPDIVHEWEPLEDENASEQATRNKTIADTDAIYLQNQVITPQEARQKLANDPSSGYDSLDLDQSPEGMPLPGEEGSLDPGQGGLGTPQRDPAERDGGALSPDERRMVGQPRQSTRDLARSGQRGARSNDDRTDRGDGRNDRSREVAQDGVIPFAFDKEWNEADHPRGQPGNAGEFAPAGSGSAGIKNVGFEATPQNEAKTNAKAEVYKHPVTGHSLITYTDGEKAGQWALEGKEGGVARGTGAKALFDQLALEEGIDKDKLAAAMKRVIDERKAKQAQDAFNPSEARETDGKWTKGAGGSELTAKQTARAKAAKAAKERVETGMKSATPEAFVAARDKSKRSAYLTPHPASELGDHTLLTNEDGTVGVSVDPKGDIQNVFNNGGPKGGAAKAIVAAIAAGGRTLDCYDGFLPKLYSQFGFQEDGRMKFNPEYAPKGWDFEKAGQPDIVFMSWRGYMDGGAQGALNRAATDRETWKAPERSKVNVTDWEAAKEASRAAALPRGDQVSEGHGAHGGPGTDSAGGVRGAGTGKGAQRTVDKTG